MKKKWKILGGIFLILVITIFYMGYTFYKNISDANDSDLLDCSRSSQHEFLGTTDCLYYHLINCIPASNYNGFHILGWRGNKCKIITGTSSEDMYICYLREGYLDGLRYKDYNEIEPEFIDLIVNLNVNAECESVGFSTFFFKQIWK